jgi:hypothetical protein
VDMGAMRCGRRSGGSDEPPLADISNAADDADDADAAGAAHDDAAAGAAHDVGVGGEDFGGGGNDDDNDFGGGFDTGMDDADEFFGVGAVTPFAAGARGGEGEFMVGLYKLNSVAP